MYFPVIQLTGDSKNKSVANRKWISQEYTFFVFICRQQYFLCVFFWTLSQLFCSNSSQTGSQFDLSFFQTPLTFIQTKDQKTLWFTFPRQAKFICSTSTVFFFFFMYRLKMNHWHSGHKRHHHCFMCNQALMQRSEAHNKQSKRRFRLYNKDTLVQLDMMERGSDNWCCRCLSA